MYVSPSPSPLSLFPFPLPSLIGRNCTNTTCVQADLFQELEKDPQIRKRFEEAAALELQQGWDRGKKKSGLEVERVEAEQAAREGEVQNILRNRPETLEEGRVNADIGVSPTEEPSPTTGRSIDVQEMLSRRFGTVRSESVS